MIVIACVDDDMGIAFNHRRQSRDRELCKRILEKAAGKPLWMTSYSAKLFQNDMNNICISENLQTYAGEADYCFVESLGTMPDPDRISGVILYRWNRSYPSDQKLNIPLDQFRLVDTYEFAGHSHEKITEEVYER